MRLASATLVVRSYDEAIAWFTAKLGFTVAEDRDFGNGNRWVRIAAPGGGSDIVLGRAGGNPQVEAIGNACGGRVAFFLHSDDFDADFAAMKAAGVSFMEDVRDEDYGRVVVFTDLYGNKWDLVGPAKSAARDSAGGTV